MSFDLRDGRRQRLTEALAALVDDPAGVREVLEREQAALAGDDWAVSDRTYRAVLEDWLWTADRDLVATVNADPVFTALGTGSVVTADQSSAVSALPRLPGNPGADFLTQVRTALDDDEVAFTELAQAVHASWLLTDLADRSYPFDDVAVLLPLRLETLFDAPGSERNPDPTRWLLSLRVVPDEASICRDDPFVSPGELAAVTAFWQSVQLAGALDPSWLDGDAAPAAWALLADRVTAPRAAWLVSALLPEVDGDVLRVTLPPDMPETPAANRVGGLPPRLQVWASTRDPGDDVVPTLVGQLPMDDAAVIDGSALDLPLPSDPDQARSAWWASWETAKAVGLGGEWLLDDGLTPDTLDGLCVLGAGDEPPQAHFRAQSDGGELALLALGTPTNTVHGAAAAGTSATAEPDAGPAGDDWLAVARARVGQVLPVPVNPASSAGVAVEQALTGEVDGLPFFPGASGSDDTQDSQRIAQALWPALSGRWLIDVWEVGDDAFRAATWAFPVSPETPSSFDDVRLSFRDPDQVDRQQRTNNFCPEGPLMPLRIGDQPYGLLPVTALSRWRPGGAVTLEEPSPEEREQQRVEEGTTQALTALRRTWSAAARSGGTTVGASSERFLELLGRDALSRRYVSRWFTPASSWVLPFHLDAAGLGQLNDFLDRTYRGVAELVGRMPDDRYLTNGYPTPTRLPLVQPTRTTFADRQDIPGFRVALTRLLELFLDSPILMDPDVLFRSAVELDDKGEYRLHVLPDSLLIRLLVNVCQTVMDWRTRGVGDPFGLPAVLGQLTAVRELSQELDQKTWNPEDRDPVTGLPIFRTAIPDARRTQLERALRATLDSAAHRIDPWVTGFAWQRLKEHSVSSRRSYRLGAYGWVDGPFLGQPGPTDAGRLHTPSYNQTLAAIILRDKFLSSARAGATNDGGRNPWEMTITSAKARLAEEIADEVRLGFHIYEIVGRHVEHVVATHQAVKALRVSADYAMRPERQDPNEVCNGIAALRGLLAGDPAFVLTADQLQQLEVLDASLDTYADLLMADGVMQLVNRQLDRASDTMDAAAGFSKAPSLEFIRTPPSGYQLESLVLGAVPWVSLDDPADCPLRRADPSVAAFVESRVGADWTWTAVDADTEAVLDTATLASLGLTALSALVLSTDFLAELARRSLRLPLVFITEAAFRAWSVTATDGTALGTVSVIDLALQAAELAALDLAALHDRVRAFLGADPTTVVQEVVPTDRQLWTALDEQGTLLGMVTLPQLGLTPVEVLDPVALRRAVLRVLGLPEVRIDPPRQHQLGQQLLGALGSRPAAGRDLATDPDAQHALDLDVYQELSDRFLKLRLEGESLVADLTAVVDEALIPDLLRRALGWGITPVAGAADREALFAALTDRTPTPDATPPAALVTSVSAALQARLDAAPQPGDLASAVAIATPLADHEERKRDAVPDGVPTLAQAIATLAAPEITCSILAGWPQPALLTNTRLELAAPEPDLDETWLTVVAAVRPGLARLEALQLELEQPLSAWSSSPGDPWRSGEDHVVSNNLKLRREQSPLAMTVDDRFVAAYGPEEAWAGERVAVGLIDAFGEAVPMPQRSTMAAFGFNAPAARAPQAILLAVPPQVRQRLDDQTLLDTVLETRELAQARTAHVEDLGALQALTPTLWLPGSGSSRVRLEPRPLYR